MDRGASSERRAAGLLLCLAVPIGVVGILAGSLGAGENFSTGITRPDPPLEPQFTFIKNLFSPALSIHGFSRLLIGVAAPLSVLLGFAVLTDLLRDAGDRVLSWLGLLTYLLGTVFIVIVELNDAMNGGYLRDYAHLYTFLAFIVQAVYGIALLRTGLVPTWVGWTTIVWNLGWLAWFYTVNYPTGPGYYPGWHWAMPFLIGAVLLLQARRTGSAPAIVAQRG